MRRTKIVATIGPASQDEAKLTALLHAGVDVVRLNFAHGTHAEHAAAAARVRAIAARLNRPVALLGDLAGPKIRVGALEGGAVQLDDGASLVLTPAPETGTAARLPTTYPALAQDVKPGDRVLLDDGALELRVVAIADGDVTCRVVHGGWLKEHKGINLPGIAISAPALTDKDQDDLAFALAQGADYIALSFVRRADDLRQVKELLARRDADVPLIAKLEKPEALQHLDAILEIADGVMVARGDLGVELSPAQVPTAQKTIIATANARGVPVITATQMLESMVANPRPTRAEASDVANAIFDGTDAVMLSEETATGAYPVEAVQMMAEIAVEAEAALPRWGRSAPREPHTRDNALAIGRAACELAGDRDVVAIAAFTRSGRTARLISKERPRVPILAFTPDERICRRLALLWGVIPYQVLEVCSVEEMVTQVEHALTLAGYAGPGDQVVLVGGLPVTAQTPTNFVKLHQINRQ